MGRRLPAFKWRQLAPHVPVDLAGWSCLDIGCNARFYTFELARRRATVLGIDVDVRYLRQARWAATRFGGEIESRVRFEQMQVYDLAHLPDDESFDLVLFMGVLYHLRYPMLGLDLACQRVRRRIVFRPLTTPGEAVFDDTTATASSSANCFCVTVGQSSPSSNTPGRQAVVRLVDAATRGLRGAAVRLAHAAVDLGGQLVWQPAAAAARLR